MDKDAAKRFIEGNRRVNEVVIEEERRRSPEERFRRFLEFRSWLESIGRLGPVDADRASHEEWVSIQRKCFKRGTAV